MSGSVGNQWPGSGSGGRSQTVTLPLPPHLPALQRLLPCAGVWEQKKNHPGLSIGLHLSFPPCFLLTAAKSHFAVNHRVTACFLLQTWLSFPAEQAVLQHRMSPTLLISKMPPQANCVNIGECRSGGRAAHPQSLLFIAHRHAGE